jgi:hypothetical protein
MLKDGCSLPLVEDTVLAGNRSVAFEVDDPVSVGRALDAFYGGAHRKPPALELTGDTEATKVLCPRQL